MCQTGRFYNCASCHKQVIICSDCDRGQIYCNSECSQLARQESMRAANARYQQTQKGGHNHADRQSRYRQQQQNQQKVTYQGSPETTTRDVLSSNPARTENALADIITDELCCHFCQKPVSDFLRNRFLTDAERHYSTSVTKIT